MSNSENNKFYIVDLCDGKTEFTDGTIIITIGLFAFCNGKHHIHEPQAAKAWFMCGGERYVIENAGNVATVEDWYWEELLPKFQMLNLLKNMDT